MVPVSANKFVCSYLYQEKVHICVLAHVLYISEGMWGSGGPA